MTARMKIIKEIPASAYTGCPIPQVDYSEFGETVWGSQDGKEVKFKDMPLGHFVNVLNWVLIDHQDSYTDKFARALMHYANCKSLHLFAEGVDYPQCCGPRYNDRWFIVNHNTGELYLEHHNG